MSWAGKKSFKESLRSLFPIRKQAPSLSVDPLPGEQREEVASLLQDWVQQKGYRLSSQSPIEVADSIGLPYSILYRYFLDEGKDFRTWRTQLRLQDAVQQIKANPSLPFSTVSRQAGFSDRSNFARLFKEHFGLTPGEWKKDLKNFK